MKTYPLILTSNFYTTSSSGPVEVGEDAADDAEVAEASPSPQSNGRLLQVLKLHLM